ncbi:MAG: hypothetical protein AUH81_00300 [Candidatus Rokubacteria bacterium 13_1_40CM_4_69_5]|nr:MAG: hypothetical protein AUH81_00300 [Candidatus Rokubacteria bacterium 13_1_40CM_4_69_5]
MGVKSVAACVAFGCLLLPAAKPAQAQERLRVLSLEEALTVALRENPTLRAKTFELQATRAQEITAGVRPNPTASYTAEKFGSSSQTFLEHTATVGQTIETGGKRRRRLDSARAATRVAGYELDDTRRQVLFQAKKSFTDVLVAQATLGLAEQNLRTLDEVERIQRFRAERGDISELELTRIQVQRFAFERDAADARQAITVGKIALRSVVGASAIAEDFEVVGDLAFGDVPVNREELYRLALARRPDLRAADAARDKARADINLARANAWWDVTPQVEYKRTDANEQTFGFGISVPIRIFDRNQGEIARTRAEAERVDAQREAVATQALSEVDTAISTVLLQRERITVLRDTYLPKAERARQTVEFAYRRGGVSLLDFLDAQRTYRETALEHVRALGNYWGALYQLEAAVGGSWEK